MSQNQTISMVLGNYGPVQSEHDSNYYRVMVEQVDTTYTIHTGDNMMRILKEFELPKEIRTKLTMIKAYESREENKTVEVDGMFIWSTMELYLNQDFPPEFNDIGWRCRSGPREFYCVITTAETLDSLRGEPL